MKTAIILHGKPMREQYFDASRESESNSHWLPWIQRRLLLRNVLAQTPEMPEPYEPKYEDWKRVFEQFEVTEDTILIGHSCGAGFLVRWLSENKVRTGAVVLVASWLDPEPHELETSFFKFEIDPTVPERAASLTILSSDNDYETIKKSEQMLREMWPTVNVVELHNKGHFTMSGMGTREFPELEHILFS